MLSRASWLLVAVAAGLSFATSVVGQDVRYAPPRSVADIIGLTSTLRVDESEQQRFRALLGSEVPAGGSRRDLVNFHLERAQAATGLGDTARFIVESRKALEFSDPGASYGANNETERRWILSALAGAEGDLGNLDEGIRLFRQMLRETQSPGWQIGALSAIAYYQGERGDLLELEKTIRQLDAVFMGASGNQSWRDFQHNWRRLYEGARSWYHYRNGRFLEAELSALRSMRAADDFREAARGLRARNVSLGAVGWEHTAAETARINLAFFQLPLNKLDEAEYHAREGLVARISRSRYIRADFRTGLQRLGDIMLNRGRFVDAELMYREALRVLDVTGVPRSASRSQITQQTVVTALIAQGRWRDAIETDRGRMRAVGRDSYNSMGGFLAYAFVRDGQAALAVKGLEATIERHSRNEISETPVGVLVRGIYAVALSELGQLEEAERVFIAVIPKLSGKDAPSILSVEATPFLELYRRLIVHGYLDHLRKRIDASNDPSIRERAAEEALVMSDAVRARSVQAAIQHASVRAAAGTPELSGLARKDQDLRNEIGALYAILNTRRSEGDGKGGDLERQLKNRIAVAEVERRQIGDRMRREFTRYADLVAPQPPGVAQLRAALRPDEALLALHVTDNRVFVWAVRREGPVQFGSPDARTAIESDLMRLRRSLDPSGVGIRDRIPAFDVVAAHRLYRQLIAPIEGALTGVRSIIVVANGAFQQVPLGVLLTQPATLGRESAIPFQEYRGLPWLSSRYALSQAPSLAAFVALRNAAPFNNTERRAFAGFGDPIFSKEQAIPSAQATVLGVRGVPVSLRSAFSPTGLGSAELGRLPRLPDTGEEVLAIARILGASVDRDVFLGARANEKEALSGSFSDRRVLMFATHGLVPGDLDGLSQPALALSAPDVAGITGDGLLTMEEILSLKLNADWVVLSACNTASGDGAGGDAISGLGRAFFYAGARALLVSSWPVETVSARRLTTAIFSKQATNPSLPRAEALRQSMMELAEQGVAIGSDGKAAYSFAHPIFWAPFSIVGDGN